VRTWDAQSLANTVARTAGVAKEHVKILDCQRGSVIALTVILATDWSAASTQLQASLMHESGPFKDMGVVGCVGLLGGVVGTPPQTAAAAAAQDMLGLAAHTTMQGARSMAQELQQTLQTLAEDFDAQTALLHSVHAQELHDMSVRLSRLTPSGVSRSLAEVDVIHVCVCVCVCIYIS
jgi:hypothetical protein